MRKLTYVCLLIASWSCSKDDGLSATDDDAPRTFAEAQALYQLLREDFNSPLTHEEGFPISGVVIYKGLHMGEVFGTTTTSETTLDYFADVEFTLDFEAQTFTGQLTNFTTNLTGFENPQGTLNVSGSIRGTAELGADEFGLRFQVQAGELTQSGRTASFDAFTENKGRFLGETAQSVNIRVSSLFTWTQGPDAGTASGTLGFMHAQARL